MRFANFRAWRCIGFGLCGLSLLCCQRSPAERSISVFAASSLREAFEQVGRQFEARHRGLSIEFNFAGSQVLLLQLEQGARADVYASASIQHVNALRGQGLVHRPQWFADNELIVVVPRDNPAAVGQFRQLDQAQRLIVGNERVPVGEYTRQLFDKARRHFGAEFVAALQRHVVSRENNARLVRAKVEWGEADAAIVYRTDAQASSALRSVEIPSKLNVRAQYWAAPVVAARQQGSAQEFITYLRSAEGRQVLREHGFLTEAL